jgi:hypothetical protein
LGEINQIVIRFLKFKKGQLELLQTQEWEIHVENCLKKLEVPPLYSQYILSISIFVVKNKHLFYWNKQIHSIHTRSTTNLHPPTAHLTKFQKGVYYSAIKIFNNLLHDIKDLSSEVIPFRNALKSFYFIKLNNYFSIQH